MPGARTGPTIVKISRYLREEYANPTVLGKSRGAESNLHQCLSIFLFLTRSNTYTHPFNGPLSGTTRMGRYQKGKTNLDFTEARDSEWQWNLLGHMQVCTLLQTDNHRSVFYRPGALPAAQPTASKH